MTKLLLAPFVAVPLFLSLAQLDEDKPQSPKVDLKKLKSTVDRLQGPVTLDLVETPLKDALVFLEEFAQLKFVWDYEILPAEKALTVSAFEGPLGEALQKALDSIGWTYAIQPDGEVLLRPVPKPPRK